MSAAELDHNSFENLVSAAYLSAQLGFSADNVRSNPYEGNGFQLRWLPLGITEVLFADEFGTRIWEIDETSPRSIELRLMAADTTGIFKEDSSFRFSSKYYGGREMLPQYALPFRGDSCPLWSRPPLNPVEYPARKIREINFDLYREKYLFKAVAVSRGIREMMHLGA